MSPRGDVDVVDRRNDSLPSSVYDSRGPRGLRSAVPWLGGVLTAALLLGPALGPGYLLSLDLVLTPRIPVPNGMWGLGPELPRRVPLGIPLAWISDIVGGAVAGKGLLIGCVVLAFAGAYRLAVGTPVLCRLGAAILYAAGPFATTRLAAGHWDVLAAMAILPWALPTLLVPGERPRLTFLWAAALGATGFVGGIFAALALLVGIVADRGHRAGRVILLAALGQLPWAVPALVVALTGSNIATAGGFATRAEGPLGIVGALAAGHGFWRSTSQVGGTIGLGPSLIGVGVAGLAVLGARDLDRRWGARAAALAVVGFGLAAASGVPGLRDVYDSVSRTPVLVGVRESQRALALYLVWAAPAAAHGARRLARGAQGAAAPAATLALPLAAGLVLMMPGVLGAQGRLDPVRFPRSWQQARARIQRQPGTVLALPWHEYLSLGFASDRRVLNPLPDYLGGDVLGASDPELSGSAREQADPREPAVTALLAGIRSGKPLGDRLARLGVHWIVLLHEVDWQRLQNLERDPSVATVLRTDELTVFEVRSWRGPVVTDSGRALSLQSVLPPVADIPASGAATWSHPGATGWMRGLHAGGVTRSGLVRLPRGGGLVWFWPALLVIAADLLVIATLCVCATALRRHSSARPKEVARTRTERAG